MAKVNTAKGGGKSAPSRGGRSRTGGSGTIYHNEAILEEVKAAMDQVIIDVSQQVLDRVTELTPVDTGFAQSRWELGAVNEEGFEIHNDANYIEYLENGSSTQAPNGMLGITLMEVPRMVDEAVAKHRVD